VTLSGCGPFVWPDEAEENYEISHIGQLMSLSYFN